MGVYENQNGTLVNIAKRNGGGGGGGILPHIIVISETGSIVTLTKGTEVIAATETSTGHFEADVTSFGTWTIDAILSGDDAQVSLLVDSVKIYTVDDSHFHADITVTYPSSATQCSLSASGQTTMYATSSPYTFTVHSAGIYTCSCINDGVTRSTEIVVSTTGEEFAVNYYPTGSTVTPINDIETWLDCAGIWKNYTTLSEVIGDSDCLLRLISNNNAVDYMVRSSEFTTDITGDSLAMLYIGQYNYATNTLLDDNTWSLSICNSNS